jgi:sporulation protein YlmC with PRC-barrel domain
MRSTMTMTALEPLSQTSIEVADAKEDVRRRKVFDRAGQEIGKVDEVFVDPGERRARFVSVKTGDVLGLGGKQFLIPVDAIASAAADRIVIDESRDRILKGPRVDDDSEPEAEPTGMWDTAADADAPAIVIAAYQWYDIRDPYWSPTYRRPAWS